jgi:hypothetical protein
MQVMRITLLIVIFLLISMAPIQADLRTGTGLDPLLPDRYSCPAADGCNHCQYSVQKIGPLWTVHAEGCTERGCMQQAAPQPNLTKQCAANWLYADDLHYNALPAFTNLCINGYRRHNYSEQPKSIDFMSKNYAFAKCLQDNGGANAAGTCQDGYTSYMMTEPDAAARHRQIALELAMNACTHAYKNFLEQGFAEPALTALGLFIRTRIVADRRQTIIIAGQTRLVRDVQKDMIDFSEKMGATQTGAITPQLIKSFATGYALQPETPK